MAFNLFVAYDLNEPGQNYDTVRDRIKSLGTWWQFQYSLFYLNTELSASEAFESIASVMDANDRLIVINALSGVVSDWDKPPLDAINAIWRSA